LCDRVNADHETDLVELAAYVLWRLNWIHPFGGGNGRTSRAITYSLLTAWFGHELPGKPTVLELLISERERYTEALRDADASFEKSGVVDVGKLTELLDNLLVRQLRFLDDLPS
jgi:Fic family protein